MGAAQRGRGLIWKGYAATGRVKFRVDCLTAMVGAVRKIPPGHGSKVIGGRQTGVEEEDCPCRKCQALGVSLPLPHHPASPTPVKLCPAALRLVPGTCALPFPGLAPILLASLKASFPSRGQ